MMISSAAPPFARYDAIFCEISTQSSPIVEMRLFLAALVVIVVALPLVLTSHAGAAIGLLVWSSIACWKKDEPDFRNTERNHQASMNAALSRAADRRADGSSSFLRWIVNASSKIETGV